MDERQRSVEPLREWDWVRVEMTSPIAEPPAATWIAEGRLWLNGNGTLLVGNDFVRHAGGVPSSGLVRVIEHRPLSIEERLELALTLAAGKEVSSDA